MSGGSFFRQRWLQALLLGLVLFVAAEQALKITSSPNFFPTVLLIGAFLIPIVFVIYIYEYERKQDITRHVESPLTLVVSCFLLGGIIGTIVAIRDHELVLKVDESTNTKMTFIKDAVRQVITDTASLPTEPADK